MITISPCYRNTKIVLRVLKLNYVYQFIKQPSIDNLTQFVQGLGQKKSQNANFILIRMLILRALAESVPSDVQTAVFTLFDHNFW